MSQPADQLRKPECQRITAAFRSIRRAGGMTQTGLCCQSCSWAAIEGKGATEATTVAIYHVQGRDAAWPEGQNRRMKDALHIYHSGDSRSVYEALQAQDLRVEWNGSAAEAIVVLPDLFN